MDGGTDPFKPANTFANPWYGRLFTDPDFWQRWIDRYQDLRKTTYSSSNVTALISRFAGEVTEATTREYARWRGSGSSDTTPNQGTVSATVGPIRSRPPAPGLAKSSSSKSGSPTGSRSWTRTSWRRPR